MEIVRIKKINPVISYIFATNEPIPIQYNDRVQKVTLYNTLDIIKVTSDYAYPDLDNIDSQLVLACGFSGRQIMMQLMIQHNDLGRLINIVNAVSTYEHVYLVMANKEYLDANTELYDFITTKSEIIERKQEAEYEV